MIVFFSKKNKQDPGPSRLLVWAPDSDDLEGLKNLVRERELLPRNVAYGLFKATYLEAPLRGILQDVPRNAVFLFQYDVSELPAIPFQKAPVLGGDPSLPPLGSRGRNRPNGERDNAGFGVLGDQALGVDFDPMFGPLGDGTVSDLIGGVEVPRET
jgi:hypothetical protein